MFYQLPPKGYKFLEALIRMCSKCLTHLHQKMEMWKTTKHAEERSIEYCTYGSLLSAALCLQCSDRWLWLAWFWWSPKFPFKPDTKQEG